MASKELQRMKKMMAKKMGYKMALRFRVPAKAGSHALIKAKKDKKDLPYVPPSKEKRDSDYYKQSIEEFEKNYND